MKADNKYIGKLGEDAAVEFLTQKNYEIIKRNFSTRFGEIDIIAKDKNLVVFVEVKTKKGLDFGLPEEMFGRGKYQRVKHMATVYLNGRDIPCRIDMIAVILDPNNQLLSLKHYPNVIF